MADGKRISDNISEADEFWSLDSLLPPTEKKKYSGTGKNGVSLAEIEISGDETAERGEKIPKREGGDTFAPITGRKSSEEEKRSFEKWLEGRRGYENNRAAYGKRTVLEYSPEGRYIKKVTVSEETGRRVGNERFVTDGKRLLGLRGEYKGNVPFESFYPQYSQLSDGQRKCYIAFRTEVLCGRFPEVSRAYIYLYLYEIINVSPEKPEMRAERIAALINGYRGCDERLFSDMCRWLCDLCLIHKLKIPKSIYGDVFPRVLECAQTKEIFLDLGETEYNEKHALILNASRYDYKKSKFYPEFSEYYDKYIPEAVSAEIKKLCETDSRFSDIGRESCTLTRESYFGAFCSGQVRRTVTLELRCITGDETVKKTVSDMVKYAENRLRAELMIKPRLSVIYLPVSIRDGIKAFFAERSACFPKKREKMRYAPTTETVPEYERLYEPKERGISEESAREIEKSSWEITERLVSAFGGEEESSFSDTENAVEKHEVHTDSELKSDSTENALNDTPSPDDTVISALKLLLLGDGEKFRALARESGYLIPAFADLINETLFEIIGDSAVYVDGDNVFITEDYVEDIKDIIEEHRENG